MKIAKINGTVILEKKNVRLIIDVLIFIILKFKLHNIITTNK